MKISARLKIPTSSFKGDEYGVEEDVLGFTMKDGQMVFGVISTLNRSNELESYRDATDFKSLMAQLQPSAVWDDYINVMEPFQDIDLRDPLIVAQYSELLKENFNNLPKEVKNEFNNDSSVFFNRLIRGEYTNISEELENKFKKDTSNNIPNDGEKSNIGELEKRIDDLQRRIDETQKGVEG